MRGVFMALMLAALLAPAARAQPTPPEAALMKGLFGEREPEPGDEEAAAGQAEPAPAQAPAPAAPSTTPGYDSRVEQSFAAAESFRGPLDGGWTLVAKGEGPIYDIRFSENEGRLEAAWRDLRREGALDASGLVQQAERNGGRLTLRFSPAAGVEVVARLSARKDGAWKGELDENGRKRAVTLSKTSP